MPSTFIYYRRKYHADVDAPEAERLWRALSNAFDRAPWFAMAEYAACGGYFPAARIEADTPEQAWDRAHTDHNDTARYVRKLSDECPGHSSSGDVYYDEQTDTLWFCLGVGWAEAPDDVQAMFLAWIDRNNPRMIA